MSRDIDGIQRCVNLDWLEVSVLEPPETPHDADYFRACGWFVMERDYGTRVWGEMFTLEGKDGLPFLEVRRAPKSEVIAPNIAHLRFVNRVCYFPNAAQLMQDFIDQYGYQFVLISRVDICLDLEKFDYGDLPRDFMKRLISEKYAKIHQGTIFCHGDDKWAGRVWNSVSWGSPTSDVGTKFYNKTLELYDPTTDSYGKPYIRQAWQACGLVDDATRVLKYDKNGNPYTPEIWRIEFSIRSSVKKWFLINLDGKEKKKQSIRNTLDMYNSHEKLLVLFASLSEHYFHFKHLIKHYNFHKEGHTDGYAVRKDLCPDKLLFNWKGKQMTYKVEKQEVATSEKADRTLSRLLVELKNFRDTCFDTSLKRAAQVIIDHLENKIATRDQSNPISVTQAKAFQKALHDHIDMPWLDPAFLIKLAKEELKLRDRLVPFI